MQIKKSLLADSQNSFLWSVQISNQFDDYSKRDRDGDNRERSASSTEAGMVTHGDKRKRRDCEKAQPDCAGNSAPHCSLQAFRVQIDHLIKRLNEKADND